MNQPMPEYVGFWARVGAAIIDSILLAIVLVPVVRLLGGGYDWDDLDSPRNILGAACVQLVWGGRFVRALSRLLKNPSSTALSVTPRLNVMVPEARSGLSSESSSSLSP